MAAIVQPFPRFRQMRLPVGQVLVAPPNSVTPQGVEHARHLLAQAGVGLDGRRIL
jgi:hypothetical protein